MNNGLMGGGCETPDMLLCVGVLTSSRGRFTAVAPRDGKE